jgi:choline dehydrogenase-like flavoprotein
MQTDYDVIIAGSGTGGGTLAKELSRRGKRVLVLERGRDVHDVGTFSRATGYYDCTAFAIPRKSEEGTILWHTLMAGGTSMVSCANAVRALEGELAALGIDLQTEYAELEAELRVAPTPDDLMSAGSAVIREAAESQGYHFEPMPKFIRPMRCTRCGRCVLGCRFGARWTAQESLEEAVHNGAEVVYGARVERVLQRNGSSQGVLLRDRRGHREVRAETTVLSAGALATPLILKRAGMDEAGRNLFIDIQVMTYGATEEVNLLHEPSMSIVDTEFQESEGFLLSTFVNHSRPVRMIEAGAAGFALPTHRILGIMTKQADDAVGEVHADGRISKPLTEADRARIQKGTGIAAEILRKVGVRPNTLVNTYPAGSHSGGTAAINTVVDTTLRTQMQHLYVCDASVLPKAPGNPPILTIMALAKRLASHLAPATAA